MSSSTSAQRSSKSSIDSYDEYMDEYSYSSSMEEDTAHNCVEMTKPMGLALEGLNLVSLLFFFYSWPTPAHPFVDPFFSTSLGSCNVSGKRTTGRATCNWLRTRRRTCLATGARSFSSKQVRQTAKNIWSNNSKNIANSMGGVSSLFPAGMTSFVDSMQVHPQLMSDCSGAEGAWWALKKVFPQSELVSSCLDKVSILFPWIINLMISPDTKILLLVLGACSNSLFSGVTMPWGLWSSSCAMLHPKWSSAIS